MIKYIEVQYNDGSVADRLWDIEYHQDRNSYTADKGKCRYEVDAKALRIDGEWGIIPIGKVYCLGYNRKW